MTNHHKINYIEFQVKNIAATKQFLGDVFGWSFTDYGDEYCAINDGGIDAGFYESKETMLSETGSSLIVLYSDNLKATQEKIIANGDEISTPTFDFPGGKRFHFLDPNRNEYAVWSE